MKTSDEELVAYLGIQGYKVPEGYIEVESYPLNPPFSYAWIFQDESEGSYFYAVDELTHDSRRAGIIQPTKKHT